MKCFKKVLAFILLIIFVAIISFGIVEGFYLPKYLINYKMSKSSPSTNESIVVVSYNIRCFNFLDTFKKSWLYRADLIVDELDNISADIIGFQEITVEQYRYLSKIMHRYESVIDYRDNSFFKEGCPIFYNKNRFELNDKGSFWLSETPEVMSKSWGSAHYRICSYVNLKDKLINKDILIFNTHLDHKSEFARINGINLVINKINEFGNKPAILVGDLNAKPNSKTISTALNNFNNSYDLTSSTYKYTYQNWGNDQNYKILDYILVSKDNINVEKHYRYENIVDGIYTSDHSPIISHITIM